MCLFKGTSQNCSRVYVRLVHRTPHMLNVGIYACVYFSPGVTEMHHVVCDWLMFWISSFGRLCWFGTQEEVRPCAPPVSTSVFLLPLRANICRFNEEVPSHSNPLVLSCTTSPPVQLPAVFLSQLGTTLGPSKELLLVVCVKTAQAANCVPCLSRPARCKKDQLRRKNGNSSEPTTL